MQPKKATTTFYSIEYGLLRSMIPASVSLSAKWAGCAKTAEQFEVLFGAETEFLLRVLFRICGYFWQCISIPEQKGIFKDYLKLHKSREARGMGLKWGGYGTGYGVRGYYPDKKLEI